MEFQVFKKDIPYTKASGESATANLEFVDLPPGTLLFRGVRLPDSSKGDDMRYFYRDFLGDVKGDSFCLSPTHNVFFYPFPHIAFGAHTVGERFNAVQIYVLRKAIRIICMISPTNLYRGVPKAFDGTAPIQRCDKFAYDCKDLTEEERRKENEVKKWDNCLRPEFARDEKIQGWMAIADYDSIEILGEKSIAISNTPMSKYFMERNARNKGKLGEMASWLYTDTIRHRGVPEIVLYPWLNHPGPEIIMTDAANEEEAIDAILDNASNFAYLPLACITANGVLDGVATDFKSSNIGDNTKVPASTTVRGGIEKQTDAFLLRLATDGMELPDLGTTKLRFDSRTGFYVLDTFVIANKQTIGTMPYAQLLLPLETQEQRDFVQLYSVLYRSFDPKRFMSYDQLLPTMPPVYRAFIFERPPDLEKIFTNLGRQIPNSLSPSAKVALEEARILGRLAPRPTRRGPRGPMKGGAKTRKLYRFEKLPAKVEKFVNEQLGKLQRTLSSITLG